MREWTVQPGYRHTVLDVEPRVVVVSSEDPLAVTTSVTFTDFAAYHLVLNTNSGTNSGRPMGPFP